MPVLLTQPYNPGDADPEASYLYAKINGFNIDLHGKTITVRIEYGNVVGGVWVRGPASIEKQVLIQNQSADAGGPTTDYDDMISELPEESETIYNGAARVLYEYLLAEGILSGTIE